MLYLGASGKCSGCLRCSSTSNYETSELNLSAHDAKQQRARKAQKASGERKTGINPKTGRPYARRKSGMIQAECLFKDGEATTQ